MKKRIISGVVMGAVVALVLFLGLEVKSIFITVFLCVIAAIASFELVINAAGLKGLLWTLLPSVYTAVMVFLLSDINEQVYLLSATDYMYIDMSTPVAAIIVSVLYFIACAVLILVKHSEFDIGKITVVCAMPTVLAFAFSTLGSIIIATGGIYYLLLALNFACVCDMGAYFVGVSLGKTKLCPEISPNKTVEGALGGIASSIVVSLIITLCYGHFGKILPVLLLTIPLCAAGMAGDLFASIIKRKAGIKDYGNLIPGHGGILDRVDSLLFIAPLVYCLMLIGAL